MFNKILVGLALVAIGCMVASAGYKFGQHLAEREKAADTREQAPG